MSKKSSEIDRNNLDTRLAMVEQILPTLPTTSEMNAAIAAAVSPLATREELQQSIAAAVAPLATKAELVEQIDASSNRLRILIEDGRGDTRLLADSVLSLHNKVDALLSDRGSKTSR